MTPSRTEPAPPERPGAFANAAWGARRVSTSRAPQSSWSRNPGPVPGTGTLRGQQRELSGLSAWTGVRGGSAGLEGSEHGSQAALCAASRSRCSGQTTEHSPDRRGAPLGLVPHPSHHITRAAPLGPFGHRQRPRMLPAKHFQCVPLEAHGTMVSPAPRPFSLRPGRVVTHVPLVLERGMTPCMRVRPELLPFAMVLAAPGPGSGVTRQDGRPQCVRGAGGRAARRQPPGAGGG